MTSLSESTAGKEWLNHFSSAEQGVAAELIDEILLVDRNDLVSGMWELIDRLTIGRTKPAHKVALFAERPIKTVFGNIPAFFPKSRHGRAVGPGVPPIVVNPLDQEVGSEGIIAQLITDYTRANPSTALTHPGPTKMRKERVREIVILSDFIGSGRRIKRMLESLRYVATLRSWRSYRLIRFVVLAYSGTTEGVQAVRSHKLRPEVLLVTGCPTIANTFRGAQRDKIEALCESHPTNHKSPLGFGDCGSLIAFAHGCPNNVPPILYSRKSNWNPLFAGRSTSSAAATFSSIEEGQVVSQRTQDLLGFREARRSLKSPYQDQWISSMLVLAAAKSGLRLAEAISSRTHLKLVEVAELIKLAKNARWLTKDGDLTKLGEKELLRMRNRRRRKPILPSESNNFYYPTQLRAP